MSQIVFIIILIDIQSKFFSVTYTLCYYKEVVIVYTELSFSIFLEWMFFVMNYIGIRCSSFSCFHTRSYDYQDLYKVTTLQINIDYHMVGVNIFCQILIKSDKTKHVRQNWLLCKGVNS